MTIDKILEQLKDSGYDIYTQSYGGIQLGDIKTRKSIAKGFGDHQQETITIELALNKNYISLYYPYSGKYILDSDGCVKEVLRKYNYSELDEVVKDVLEVEKNHEKLRSMLWKKKWKKLRNENIREDADVR